MCKKRHKLVWPRHLCDVNKPFHSIPLQQPWGKLFYRKTFGLAPIGSPFVLEVQLCAVSQTCMTLCARGFSWSHHSCRVDATLWKDERYGTATGLCVRVFWVSGDVPPCYLWMGAMLIVKRDQWIYSGRMSTMCLLNLCKSPRIEQCALKSENRGKNGFLRKSR